MNIMGASFAPSITVTPRALPEVSRKPAKADLRVPTPDLVACLAVAIACFLVISSGGLE